SPADRDDCDEIIEINGKALNECRHTDITQHIHQCIRSKTICLRVKKRRSHCEVPIDASLLDAFVIGSRAKYQLEKIVKQINIVASKDLRQITNKMELVELNNTTPNHSQSNAISSNGGGNTGAIGAPQKLTGLATTSNSSSNAPIDSLVIGGSISSGGGSIPNELINSHSQSNSQRAHTNSRQPKHREVPVDVPDSFIGMAKQSPRYPPPKPHRQLTPVSNNVPYHVSPHTVQNASLNHQHQHQQQAQTYSQGPKIMKSSLRDSVKLKLLEQTTYNSNGQTVYNLQPAVNRAYEPDDEILGSNNVPVELNHSTERAVINNLTEANDKVPARLPDLFAVYNRLQNNLDGEFADATNEANLPKLLSIYTTVMQQQHRQYSLPPSLRGDPNNAIKITDLLQTVISLLREGNVTNETAELISILTKYEMDGLCSAFDRITQPFDFSDHKQSNGVDYQISPSRNQQTKPYNPNQYQSTSPDQPHPQQHFENRQQMHSPQQHPAYNQHPINPAYESNAYPMHSIIPDMDVDMNGSYVRIARIEKSSSQPLGATVRNENDRVVIGRIVRGGAAEKSGLLHEGDEILQVNGIEMKGKNINQVFDILNEMKGTLIFMIAPRDYAHPHQLNQPQKTLNLKALFDYDAHNDPYIPCKELGISFCKGDILHVIDQSDPNWWQAHRNDDSCTNSTLAGLIPSANFHIQRERTLAEPNIARINKRSPASILLDCGKGTSPSRRKKSLNMMMAPDEILTYEEIDLYYPRKYRKRPIVMVGPTNIGRQELRLRLLQDKSRFAAAIPHTTRPPRDGEKNGFDYHFVTKAQFEADIRAGKFVEHGEFEKHYYGTTLEAIEAVIKSEKICVLNLHVPSILILRQSHAGPILKPFFVFVQPPTNLDKLDRLVKSLKQPDEHHPSGAELQKIVDEAQCILSHCKPYFDCILPISDVERAYQALLHEIRKVETEPQWIPKFWSQDHQDMDPSG
ncbi:MAGUK p55 subfamily member 5, partial [Fragariocoptes setiger]